MSLAKLIRVMVVDDHVSSRMVTCEGLNSLGIYNVAVAKDGRDAFTKLVGSPVHLLVTDLYMPDIDGYQLVKAVRAHPKLKSTGAIILTGKKDAAVVANAKKLGVNFVLSKPFNLQGLKAAIEAVVGRLS